MPDKRRLVTSKNCFGSEKAGLLENSYHKCALMLIYEESKLSWLFSFRTIHPIQIKTNAKIYNQAGNFSHPRNHI